MKNSFYRGTRSYRIQDDVPYEQDYGFNVSSSNRMMLGDDAYDAQQSNYMYPRSGQQWFSDNYYDNSQGGNVFHHANSYYAAPYNANGGFYYITQPSNTGQVIQYVQPGSRHTVKPICVPVTKKQNTPMVKKPNVEYDPADYTISYNPRKGESALIKAVAEKFGFEYDITSAGYENTGYTVKLHTLIPYNGEQVAYVKQRVADALKTFESNFGAIKIYPSASDTIDLYLFDNRPFFDTAVGLAGSKNVSGIAFGGSGTAFISSNEYDGGIKVLTHELGHILFSKATNDAFAYIDGDRSNDGHKILNEGVSEFVSHTNSEHGDASSSIYSSARAIRNLLDKNPHLAQANSLDQMMKHGYDNANAGTIKYSLGHLLVKYYQSHMPGTMGRVLDKAADMRSENIRDPGSHDDISKAFKSIKPFPEGFLRWIDRILDHSIDPYENLKHTAKNDDVSIPDTSIAGEETSAGIRHEAKMLSQKSPAHTIKFHDNHRAKSDDSDNHHIGKTIPEPDTTTEIKSGGFDDKSAVKSPAVQHGDSGNKSSTVKEAKIENESIRSQGRESAVTVKHQVSDDNKQVVEDDHGHGRPVSNKGFADVEKDFGEVHRVSSKAFSKANIIIDLHSVKPLPPKVIKHAERILNKTLRVFEKEFGEIPVNSTPRKLDIYIFKNKNLLSDSLESIGVDRDAGGMTWPNLGKIYVSQLGKIRFENLSHEVTHQFVDYATGGTRDGVLGTKVMIEGIAEYVQQTVRNGGSKTNFELSSVNDKILKAYNSAPELEGLKSVTEISEHIGNSKNPAHQNLEYNLGSSIVRHLQITKPGLLKSVFKDAVAGKHDTDAAKSVDAVSPEFNTWLHENSSSKFIEKHELLTVRPVHCIGYRDFIKNGEVLREEAYTARLENNANQEVATLNPVAHVMYAGGVRAYNPSTCDYLNVDSRHHYLKLIDTVDGQKYVYCDEAGKEYFSSFSESYVLSAGKIMAKYDSKFTPLYDAMEQLEVAFAKYGVKSSAQELRQISSTMDKAVSLLQIAVRDVSDPKVYQRMNFLHTNNKVSKTNISETVRAMDALKLAYDAYVIAKAKMLLGTKDDGDSPEAILPRVLKSLTLIDPEHIIARENNKFTDLPVGTILSVKGTGKADSSGISVYREDVKVGELLSNVEEFVKHVDANGQPVTTFLVTDALKAIHTRYDGVPIIVVTKDGNGDKVANFITGTKSGALGDSEIEVEVNQFLDLHSKGLQSREGFPLSKGIKIAIYDKNSHNLEKGHPSIERGETTDDRGTDRVSDDRYSATIKVDNKVLVEKMSSVQFYITESRQDASGKQIDGSELCIYDIANDRYIQFPESITHLKLVKTDTGTVRLVPSTAQGDTNPDDMPPNSEAYSYIDPIYAYDRLESKSVASHSQFKLINFDKYAAGTLFSIRFDANDPRIPKAADGSVLRINDQSYISRVGIYAPNGEKIGELSSAATFFQGDVVISLDQSYSNSDFVSSLYRHEAEVEDVSAGVKKVALSGEGDLGNDSGYSNYYSFYQREKQDDKQTVQKVIDAARANKASHSDTGEMSASALDSDVHQHSVRVRSTTGHGDDISDRYSEYHANSHETSDQNQGVHDNMPQHGDYNSNGFLGM